MFDTGHIKRLGVLSSGSYNRGSPPSKGRLMSETERRRRLNKLIAWGSPLVVPLLPESGNGGLGGFAEPENFPYAVRLVRLAIPLRTCLVGCSLAPVSVLSRVGWRSLNCGRQAGSEGVS